MKLPLAALVIVAASALAGWVTAGPEDPCASMEVGSAHYLVCTLPTHAYVVSVGHNPGQEGRHQTVLDDRDRLIAGNRRPILVMNGGMYHADLSPVGLLVEEGQELSPLNLASGSGNFFLKPNGVFWVDSDGRAGVTEAGAYARSDRAVRFASQSGPLLVAGGQMHPAILPDGTSRYIRNGVGIRSNGDVVLVISRTAVSLGAFAQLFRDTLDCPDALYLDGSVSALAGPNGLRAGRRAPAGPTLRVERRWAEAG